MSNLTYLNDASVLHNLKQRYYAQLIYVSRGVCIAQTCAKILGTRSTRSGSIEGLTSIVHTWLHQLILLLALPMFRWFSLVFYSFDTRFYLNPSSFSC